MGYVLIIRELIISSTRTNAYLASRRKTVDQTLPSALSTTVGVIGISVIGLAPKALSASFTAFITQAGAPAVPASPAPLAPSSLSAVGVTTWPTSMSGISAAIGTR